MAIEATQIYRRHFELYDEEALAMHKSGELRTQLRGVRPCPKPADSRALNKARGPCMIIAGSGMCTGGRILHHLAWGLPREETRVLITGFQSQGSLGRALVDGKKIVTIRGDKVPVRASIHTMGGLSGHAGQGDLLRWFDSLAAAKPKLVLTHGEDRARTAIGTSSRSVTGINARHAKLGEVIEL
jgi:metallo-beta-lactamase family protein